MNLDELLIKLDDARSLNMPERDREELCSIAHDKISKIKTILESIERGCSFPENNVEKAVRDRARKALAV